MALGVEYSGTARLSLVTPPPNHSKKKRGTRPMTNERLGLGLARLLPWWGHSPKQRLICRYHVPQNTLSTIHATFHLVYPTASSPLGTVKHC